MFEFAKIRDKPKVKSSVTHSNLFSEYFLIFCDISHDSYDIYMSNGDKQYGITDIKDTLKTIINNGQKRLKKGSCRILIFVSQIIVLKRLFPDAVAVKNDLKDSKMMCFIDEYFEIRDFECLIGTGVVSLDSMIEWMGVYDKHPSKLKLSIASNAKSAFFQGISEECWHDVVKNSRYLQTLEDYKGLKSGSAAGFMYVNPDIIGEIIYDVSSFDKKSAYPSVFVNRSDFPIGKIIKRKINKSKKLLDLINADVWFQIATEDLPVEFSMFKSKSYNTFGINHLDLKIIDKLGLKNKLFDHLNHHDWTLFYSDAYGYLLDEVREKIVDLYDKKENAVDGSKRTFYKRQIDMLYGKGIQKYYPETDADVKRIYFRNGTSYILPSFSYIAVSAVKYELFMEFLEDDFCVACNTDGFKSLENSNKLWKKFQKNNESIFLQNKLAGFDGCNIGTWEHEYTAERFLMLAINQYAYEVDSKAVYKLSGVPKRAIVPYTSKAPDPLIWLQERPQIEFEESKYYDENEKCYKGIIKTFQFRR